MVREIEKLMAITDSALALLDDPVEMAAFRRLVEAHYWPVPEVVFHVDDVVEVRQLVVRWYLQGMREAFAPRIEAASTVGGLSVERYQAARDLRRVEAVAAGR